MQVILSEKEYKDLLEAKLELVELKNKVHKVINIKYNDDGDFVKNIRPTLNSVTIHKDRLLDLIYIGYEYREILKKTNINIE